MNRWMLYYRFRDAQEGTARNPLASIAAIVMTAMAMLLLTGMLWLNGGFQATAQLLEEQSKIRVFVEEGGDPLALAERVRDLEGVHSVSVVSREATLRSMQAVFSGQVDLTEVFAENPFPDSLSVQVRDASAIEPTARAVGGLLGVEQVVYGQAYVGRLLAMSRALQQAGALGIVTFVLIALLMVTLTTQLALLGRRDELRIRRLMGVSPSGIYGQFMLEGGLLGLTGGLLGALALTLGLRLFIRRLFSLLPLGAVTAPPVPIVPVALAGGLFMGLVASFWATRLVLRQEEGV